MFQRVQRLLEWRKRVPVTEQTFCAVDVAHACAKLDMPKARDTARIRPIVLDELPISNIRIRHDAENHAVLSWRWDVDGQKRTSCNVAAVLAHARDVGIEHLLIDFISVDQRLAGLPLINAVADFTSLFGRTRVIAAYDVPDYAADGRHFLRTLRRPWIAREILAMQENSCKIDYVGHIRGQGAREDFGFSHMMKRIWSTTFANSMLYVLTGYCDMHDVSELPLIMPEHALILKAAADCLTRNDALLTAAMLSQSSSDPRVNGDINLRHVKLKKYVFMPAEASVGFWQNWDIVLNGQRIATWGEKEYTRDGTPRRRLTAEPGAASLVSGYLNLAPAIPVWPLMPQGSSVKLNSNPNVSIIDLSSRFSDIPNNSSEASSR